MDIRDSFAGGAQTFESAYRSTQPHPELSWKCPPPTDSIPPPYAESDRRPSCGKNALPGRRRLSHRPSLSTQRYRDRMRKRPEYRSAWIVILHWNSRRRQRQDCSADTWPTTHRAGYFSGLESHRLPAGAHTYTRQAVHSHRRSYAQNPTED